MSIFANDSKGFQILRTYIRYKKLYSRPIYNLLSSRYINEPSFRAFSIEINLIITNCLKTDNTITQKHFQNLLDQHMQDNKTKNQLDLLYPMFLLIHFTEKESVCLQLLLNKLNFRKLFEEYKQSTTDKYTKRIFWEIFLQAISRKMIHKADSENYLQTFISDFVIETSKGPIEYLVFKEEMLVNQTNLELDLDSFEKIVDRNGYEVFFRNLWLFDKKLIQMMLVYFYVSIDLQGRII